MNLLDDEYEGIVATALECLSMLTSTCFGEKTAKEVKLLKIAAKLLYDEVCKAFCIILLTPTS